MLVRITRDPSLNQGLDQSHCNFLQSSRYWFTNCIYYFFKCVKDCKNCNNYDFFDISTDRMEAKSHRTNLKSWLGELLKVILPQEWKNPTPWFDLQKTKKREQQAASVCANSVSDAIEDGTAPDADARCHDPGTPREWRTRRHVARRHPRGRATAAKCRERGDRYEGSGLQTDQTEQQGARDYEQHRTRKVRISKSALPASRRSGAVSKRDSEKSTPRTWASRSSSETRGPHARRQATNTQPTPKLKPAWDWPTQQTL